MKLIISGTPVVQFRSDSSRPYFQENYIFEYQKVEREEKSGRRMIKKMVDDTNTVFFHHVIVRPDGYYVTEEKPLVFTRITEENESQ